MNSRRSAGPISGPPLAGIRILEVGVMLAGPYATCCSPISAPR